MEKHQERRFTHPHGSPSLILNFPFNFIRPKSDCRNGILITYSHTANTGFQSGSSRKCVWIKLILRDGQIYSRTECRRKWELVRRRVRMSRIPQLWTSLIGFFIVSISRTLSLSLRSTIKWFYYLVFMQHRVPRHKIKRFRSLIEIHRCRQGKARKKNL